MTSQTFEDKLDEANKNMSEKYDIQPLARCKHKNAGWLHRKIAEYRFRRYLRKLIKG